MEGRVWVLPGNGRRGEGTVGSSPMGVPRAWPSPISGTSRSRAVSWAR